MNKKIIVTKELKGDFFVEDRIVGFPYFSNGDVVRMPFSIGEKAYVLMGDRLIAFKVISYTIVGRCGVHNWMSVQMANGKIQHFDFYKKNLFFKTIEDYYRYVGGDYKASVDVYAPLYAHNIHNLLGVRYGVPFGYSYAFDNNSKMVIKKENNIKYVVITNDKIFVVVYNNDRYPFDSAEDALKGNAISNIIDFMEDVEISLKIRCSKPIEYTISF